MTNLSRTVWVDTDTDIGSPTVDAGNNALSVGGVSGTIELSFTSWDNEGGNLNASSATVTLVQVFPATYRQTKGSNFYKHLLLCD